MLEINNLNINYTDFTLLVSLTAHPCQITVITGASGAGKSTLINAIAGFLPHSGQIILNQQDISKLPPSKRSITTIFQNNNLFPHLTVHENLALALSTTKTSPLQQQQIIDALTKVDMIDFISRYPDDLSGGEIQRVAIARSLLTQNKILLLDEPFAALGPRQRKSMLNLIYELTKSEQLITLINTHQPNEISLAEQFIFLHQGTVYLQGNGQAVLNSKDPVIENYLDS